MSSTDVTILAAGSEAAPLSYEVPNTQEIVPLTVNATFDGTSATTAFAPTVEIVSDSGIVIARVPTTSSVAAGGSAEVTFAPFLGRAAASGGLSTSDTSLTLLGETFSTNVAGNQASGASGGALYTTIFPYVFPAGTTFTGMFQYQGNNATSGTGTGNVSFGLCNTSGLVLTTTGLLGSTKFTVFPTYLKFPFTSPLTLSADTALVGWNHWWNGTWTPFSLLGVSSGATMQNPPQDWHTVLGGIPPRSTDLAFGTAPPSVGDTISLLGRSSDGGGHSFYMGLY